MESAEAVDVAGRYRLVRKLGSGGMGSVWLAHDLSLDAPCALKLIDHDQLGNPEARLRFAREAKVAAQVRGPNVVDVFDHGEWEGVPYIAMEYLEGEDLGARLEREGRLDPQTTYLIVAQVARALVRAHAAGIVHRDLKPENIFLALGDEYEIAKVLDFGIAKHDAYSLKDHATKSGSFLGTPYYVSPEQARGRSIDHRSDLWSLAVLTFFCLTGRPPFESHALGELMGLILYEQLPWPSERNASLPSALDGWWLRAAARDPDERFQSAKELADALAEALAVPHVLAVSHAAPRTPASRGQGFCSVPPPPALPFELRRPKPRHEERPIEYRTDAPVSLSRAPEPRSQRRAQQILIGALGTMMGVALTLSLAGRRTVPAAGQSVATSVQLPRSASTAASGRALREPLAPASSVATGSPVLVPRAGVTAPAIATSAARRARKPRVMKVERVPPRPAQRDVPDYGI